MIIRTVLLLSLMACPGPEGPDGPAGADGADGADGLVGQDGQDGANMIIVEEDETWFGEVELSGSVWVKPGATVSLEAGTRVSMRPGSMLTIEGTLLSQGTADAPVQFSGVEGADDYRPDVLFAGDVASEKLSFFESEGVDWRVRGDSVAGFSDCSILTGNVTVFDRANPFAIEGCSVTPGAGSTMSAVEARGVSELSISSSTIQDANYGVAFSGYIDGAKLTIEDTNILNSRIGIYATNAIPDNAQSVTLTNVDISEVNTYAFRGSGTTLTANGLDIRGTGAQAVLSDRDVSITGGQFSDVYYDCVYVSDEYPITLSDVNFEGCGNTTRQYAVYGRGDISVTASNLIDVGRGVYSTYGNIEFNESVLRGAGYYGLFVNDSEKTLTVSDSTVEDVGYNCVYSRGHIVMNESDVTGCTGWGVYASQSTSLNMVKVSNTTGYGVGAYYGDMTIKDVTLDAIGQAGLYLYKGNLTLDGMTGSTIGADGIYVKGTATIDNLELTDVASDGVDIRGTPATINNTVLTNIGRYGLSIQYIDATVSNTTINNAASYGIRAGSLTMTDSTIMGATTAVRIELDSTDSKIDSCVISDNSTYGIYGAKSSGMQLDVVNSNIMRNGDRGVRHARELNGNYIAENKGSTDVDDTEDGTLDGDYGTSSTQLYKIDAVINPADAELTGVGAP